MSGTLDEAIVALVPTAPHRIETIGQGHINTTIRVHGDDGTSWCLQRLNPVFADGRIVMANAEMIVAQLRRLGHPTIELAVGGDGRAWHQTTDRSIWRAYRWIPGQVAADHPTPQWSAIAHHLGSFVAALADLDDSQVVTVVDRFHDPADRWRRLEQAIDQDQAGRRKSCTEDLDRLRRLADAIWVRTPAPRWHRLPRQIVHNDTKVANVVVDGAGAPLALIDLDTTMMGSPLNDLGEFTRGCRGIAGPEHAGELADLVRAFVDGLGRPVTAPEWEGLASAGAVLSFENATRAMTDHLDGDRYYELGAGVNLQRCRRHLVRSEVLLAMGPAVAEALDRHAEPDKTPG